MMKKKIISVLFGIAIFLLIANLVVETFTKKDVSQALPVYSVSEAENVVFSTINKFGIKPDWIKVVKKDYEDQDSLKHYIRIYIPADLPIPLVISDLKNSYPDSLTITTEETAKHGNTKLELYTSNIQLLQLYFQYKDDIVRPYCSLNFVTEPVEEYDEILWDKITKYPFPFSISFIPSFENSNHIKNLEGLDKNYAVLLNDEIPDNRFKLTGVSSRQRLRGVVESIVDFFGRKSFYLIDDQSAVYNSPSMNFINDEFLTYDVKLLPLSKLVKLTGKESPEVESLLRFYCTSSPADTTIGMYINIEEFFALSDDVKSLRKKGHKIDLINSNYRIMK